MQQISSRLIICIMQKAIEIDHCAAKYIFLQYLIETAPATLQF